MTTFCNEFRTIDIENHGHHRLPVAIQMLEVHGGAWCRITTRQGGHKSSVLLFDTNLCSPLAFEDSLSPSKSTIVSFLVSVQRLLVVWSLVHSWRVAIGKISAEFQQFGIIGTQVHRLTTLEKQFILVQILYYKSQNEYNPIQFLRTPILTALTVFKFKTLSYSMFGTESCLPKSTSNKKLSVVAYEFQKCF